METRVNILDATGRISTFTFEETDQNVHRLSPQEKAEIRLKALRHYPREQLEKYSFSIAGRRYAFEDLSPSLSLFRPSHDKRVVNLRASRKPLRPFSAEQNGIRITTYASATHQSGPYAVQMLMKAVITAQDSQEILSVQASDPSLEIISRTAQKPQTILRMTGTAPNLCKQNSEQETFFAVRITYKEDGKIQEIILPVDHQCLLGESMADSRDRTKQQWDFLVHQAHSDIDGFVSQIRDRLAAKQLPNTVDNVVSELERILIENKASYIYDPAVYASGLTGDDAYFLAPSETLRFGGDCEDWSVLIGAVFLNLGYRVHSNIFDSHANVAVQDTLSGGHDEHIIDYVLPETVTAYNEPIPLRGLSVAIRAASGGALPY